MLLSQHGNRRIVRVGKDMSITPYLEKFEGHRFNSPNDLVYRKDGALYFTDPPYGLTKQDDDPAKELKFNGVFLYKDGKLTVLARDLTRPNGIALSPDEKTLYVSNSDEKKRLWMRYDVAADGTISNGRVFYDLADAKEQGIPDGMKVDSQGNIYAAGPEGVWVFSSAANTWAQSSPERPRPTARGAATARRFTSPPAPACTASGSRCLARSHSIRFISKQVETTEHSGDHMKRRSYLTAMLAAFAGAKGTSRSNRRPRPDRSVLRSYGGPAREQEMLNNFHNIFKPAAEKFPGYIDVKLLKLRTVYTGSAPPGVNYRFQLTYESEELRQKWIKSDVHQKVWPTVENTLSDEGLLDAAVRFEVDGDSPARTPEYSDRRPRRSAPDTGTVVVLLENFAGRLVNIATVITCIGRKRDETVLRALTLGLGLWCSCRSPRASRWRRASLTAIPARYRPQPGGPRWSRIRSTSRPCSTPIRSSRTFSFCTAA